MTNRKTSVYLYGLFQKLKLGTVPIIQEKTMLQIPEKLLPIRSARGNRQKGFKPASAGADNALKAAVIP
jgi:hypothetical protein